MGDVVEVVGVVVEDFVAGGIVVGVGSMNNMVVGRPQWFGLQAVVVVRHRLWAVAGVDIQQLVQTLTLRNQTYERRSH